MPHAHSKLNFIPQSFNPAVLKLSHVLLPFVLRFRVRRWLIGGITRIQAENVETLVKLYQQFQAGKIRFLMAFRHPEVEDPLCLLYLLSRIVPRVARKEGISLHLPVHNHFIYDRGMVIWAGKWLGWLFSRGGGIPIHRGKPLDRIALKAARELFVNGEFPLTVAPEGATNGHHERVSPLEPGVAQLGFWCVEDLMKANRTEEVYILPISLRYYYIKPPWAKLAQLLAQLEADTGLPVQHLDQSDLSHPEEILYPRLFKLGEYLLTELEAFYHRFYRQTIPPIPEDPNLTPNQILGIRLQNLLDTALKVAEDYFNLPQQGTIIDRCRRLEEAGWNAVYREDIPDINKISPLQRGLANWIAEEGELRVKHMRLVESFVAVSGSYVKENPTAERFAETTLILFDLISRIKGVKMPRRPRLGKRRVKITIGEPISVNKRWETYQQSRKIAKEAIANLTNDLYIALEELVKI
ncbi:phospholipid/glycerol acyltransferase [Gloeothece citriformis PCC 7424]|uniref:Phospholipid/glycerol acyltransferase n=1 Tax=Gloeothece citriformis (strain PCC 7424) TaxID=65393 RepID=B7KHX7_GLOC7|nr:1-acyl-sn-glycerol-3-phosphate acyltransferase [Gloeothece citriformis]ACK72074.1 phospholipid/glycerol acyltransferase [Gloeothece citriformis PCC 7424]